MAVVHPEGGRRDANGFAPSVALAVAALVVLLLLRQRGVHGQDSRIFVTCLGNGVLDALPRHFAFLPLVSALGDGLRPLGCRWFEVLVAASALGAAFGAFALHRAGRSLCPRRVAAWWLPIALLAVPAWFFFATAAEIHGVFLGLVGCAWWPFARWHARPAWQWALLTGVATGAAATVHFAGHLLAPSLLLTAACVHHERPRRWPAHVAAFVAGHAAAVAAIALALGQSPFVQFSAAATFADTWSAHFAAGELPRVAWHEVVLPFLPWSVLVLLALRTPAARPWALAAIGTLLLHVPMAFVILSIPNLAREHGAYLLPWAVPAMLAAMHLLPRAGWFTAVATSAALALWLQAPRLRPDYDPEFAAGVVALRAERKFTPLVGAATTDVDALQLGVEDQLFVASDLLNGWVEVDAKRPGGQPLPAWFDERVGYFEVLQHPLLVCASARAKWAEHPEAAIRALWRDHVEAHYDVEVVTRRGLHGWFLRRRPPR